jgi:hypothetical protein
MKKPNRTDSISKDGNCIAVISQIFNEEADIV